MAVAALAAGGLGVTGGVAHASANCGGYLATANYWLGLDTVYVGLATVAFNNGDYDLSNYYSGRAGGYHDAWTAEIGKYNDCTMQIP